MDGESGGAAAEPWQWTLNWDEVRTDLVIGSCPMSTADIDTIRDATGVNALLSLQSDECRAAFAIDYDQHAEHGAAQGLRMVNTPMLDFNPPDQRRHLPTAVRALAALLAAGHKVYVHCTAGLNRSSLVVLAHLTWIEGASVEDAMKLMLHARPEICPTWEAYHGCRQDLTARHEERIRQRAFELGQRQPQRDARDHWLQAEREIWREVLTADEPRAKQELNEPGKAAR
jgi:atypical dual specificity phosphatase